MPAIPATGLRAFKNAIVTIGTDSFSAHVSSAQYVHNSSPATWVGLNNQTHTDNIEGATTLDLAVVQDWEHPTSLCNYLFDNAGDVVDAKIQYVDGPTFSSKVTLVKPAIGGKVNEFNESTVSLPSSAPTKAA